MLFAKGLRERVRRGRIRCTVRIWTRLKVKIGGCERLESFRGEWRGYWGGRLFKDLYANLSDIFGPDTTTDV